MSQEFKPKNDRAKQMVDRIKEMRNKVISMEKNNKRILKMTYQILCPQFAQNIHLLIILMLVN